MAAGALKGFEGTTVGERPRDVPHQLAERTSMASSKAVRHRCSRDSRTAAWPDARGSRRYRDDARRALPCGWTGPRGAAVPRPVEYPDDEARGRRCCHRNAR